MHAYASPLCIEMRRNKKEKKSSIRNQRVFRMASGAVLRIKIAVAACNDLCSTLLGNDQTLRNHYVGNMVHSTCRIYFRPYLHLGGYTFSIFFSFKVSDENIPFSLHSSINLGLSSSR